LIRSLGCRGLLFEHRRDRCLSMATDASTAARLSEWFDAEVIQPLFTEVDGPDKA